jgi:hypothetical protein
MTKTIPGVLVMRARHVTLGLTEHCGAIRLNDIHDLMIVTGLRIDDIWHRFDCAIVFREPDLRLINAFVGLG